MSTIRPLTTQQAQERGVRGLALSGNIDAPAVELTTKFAYQSYFDSTLGAAAIQRQAPNQQIVESTLESSDLSGYAVGLHPSSQTPVAISFRGGQQQGSSATFRLKPGEVIRPFGSPHGASGKFSGFDYGLPYGWLGGGNVLLVVFRTADATVDWLDRSEIIFHRVRLPILAPASVPAAAALPFNWPSRFPWPKAVRGANALTQAGAPILSVNPTRIAMTLRVASLTASETMRMYFIGSDEWSEDSSGNIDLAAVPPAYDVVWGTWASLASANYATQYQTQFLPPEAYRFSANEGAMLLVDQSGGGGLTGAYVDVVRYGVL